MFRQRMNEFMPHDSRQSGLNFRHRDAANPDDPDRKAEARLTLALSQAAQKDYEKAAQALENLP